MMNGFMQNGKFDEAIELFHKMTQPNAVVYLSVLTACAEMANQTLGESIIKQIEPDIMQSVSLQNAVMNMYAKCGDVEKAESIFQSLQRSHKADVISWTIRINAFGIFGDAQRALNAFQEMTKEVQPNAQTFVCILNACSHAGFVTEATEILSQMESKYSIKTNNQHITCVVDCLARANRLDEAESLAGTVSADDMTPWITVLGACRSYGDVQRAQRIGDRLLKIDPSNPAIYVLLGNIYATANMWEKQNEIRKLMEERNVKKTPGVSTVNIGGELHTFYAEDTSHPHIEQVYKELEKLDQEIRGAGYVPDTKWVLQDMEESQKHGKLCSHRFEVHLQLLI